MECQVEKNENFWHLLLHEFNRGIKAAQATRNICAVYGEDSIAERTAQKGFARFKQCNFDMSGTLRSGRPSDFDEDLLNALIHVDPHQRT
jgi:hypothetical protein